MCYSKKSGWLQLSATMLLISVVVACGTKPTPTPTEMEPTAMATKAPTPVPQPTEARPTPHEALTVDGSWWVIAAEDGMYGVKADGTDLTKLSDQVIYASMMGPFFEAAPSGGHLAYTQWDTMSDEETLYLLTPSSKETKVISSLSSAVGPIYQGDPFFEAREYLSSEVGVAWSPDGQKLAFVGFIDDPTMDLYLYSVDDDSITRLTDGTTPTLRPIWSPDGKYISHHGVPGLLTGSGPVVDSLWVARADGFGDRKLLDATEGAQESTIAWIDNDQLIVYSYDLGSFNLRIINVETGSEEVLWKDYFSNVAMDSGMGALLLGVDQYAAKRNPDLLQGLFLIQVDGAPAWRIVEDEPQEIVWSEEAGLFFANTEFGILAVSSSGDFIDLDVPPSSSGFPRVAPETRELAWTGSELWVSKLTSGLDNPPRQIFPEPVYHAAWGPQGQHLLFISGGGLYVARSPEFSPVLVGEGLVADITKMVHTPSLGPLVTQTPEQLGECPSPSGRTPTISSSGPGVTVVEIFEPQILDYLNNVGSATGLQAALSDLALLDGAWIARPQVETIDVTGNKLPDVVVELTFYEEGQYSEGALIVFMCQDGQFVSQILGSFAGQVLSSNDPDGIRAVRDMNMDGIPEIVHSYISIAGTHAYFIREFHIFAWDGQKFVDYIEVDPEGSVAYADSGDGVIRDTDGDGTLELVLAMAISEAYPDLGPQRARSDIWAWNGYTFTLNRWEYTAPEFRIHAIWDGDDASIFGDHDKALAFYQQAVFDEELFGWSQGRLWPDREYGGSPTPTSDPDERPRLNAYGRYRILLLHAVRGFHAEAQIVYDTLQEKFPEGAVGHPYAELATIFWDEYNESRDVGLACDMAANYAADHSYEILTFLGRDFYGAGQREYDPEDICPFR